MNINEVKEYLRITNDDDTLLTALIIAAEQYVMSVTKKTKVIVTNSDGIQETNDIKNDSLFQQCVKLLVCHWYENRGVEFAGSTSRISFSVDAIVSHITISGDYI